MFGNLKDSKSERERERREKGKKNIIKVAAQWLNANHVLRQYIQDVCVGRSFVN